MLYGEAPCGLLVTDSSGTILHANRTFCDWLGKAPDALVGAVRFQNLLTVGGRIFHQTHWAPLLQMQGSIAEVKLDLLHGEGHAIPMVMNAVSREHLGRVVHELALFVAQDRHAYERELVRARKQAEMLLAEQQDRTLFAEQMVGIVSHDLRNPLSALSMGIESLDRLGLDARQAMVVASLDRSARRARRLVDDLLDFTLARIGRGLPVVAREIDLRAVVAGHVRELAQAYPDRALVHRHDGPGACVVDSDRLFQLLGNLVGNAVAYGAPDRPITVTSSVVEDCATIAVHNAGEPIPGAMLASLFKPMVRGGHAHAGSGSVGLGLYIVAEIARAHGGSVDVASTSADGTRFVVRLGAGASAG
jgi:sigma-B regulation protein RsbU (phosphoserine phosphatase)